MGAQVLSQIFSNAVSSFRNRAADAILCRTWPYARAGFRFEEFFQHDERDSIQDRDGRRFALLLTSPARASDES